GFYGMQILIVVFLVQFLHFDDTEALLTWGAFAMMIYTTPIIGGWIGDKFFGTRRTTMLGAIVLAIGYLLLALPMAEWFIFFSFGVIAVGNGLFKANPNNLLSQLYEDDPSKLDGAFTIYYMSINLGAFASQILTPIARLHWGWHLAFGISFIGLLIGIVNFIFMKKYLSHVGSKPDFEPLRIWRLLAILVGSFVVSIVIALIVWDVTVARYLVYAAAAMLILVFLYFIFVAREESDKARNLVAKIFNWIEAGIRKIVRPKVLYSLGERKGFVATLILTLQGLIFFVFYQQMSTSLTLFAMRNVNLDYFGFPLPPEQFQVLNPFWIFVLSPFLAVLYNKLGAQDKDFHIATKFAFGFIMLAVGFFIYGVSGHIDSGNVVSPWWLLAGYFFQSFGELLISGLGLAMVARFVAPHLRGLIMGGWLLTTGISQFFGSMVANVASIPDTVKGVTGMLPAGKQGALAQVPQQLAQTISGMDLGAFRYWLAGNPVVPEGLKQAPQHVQQSFENFSASVQQTLQQLPPVSQLPQPVQNTMTQLNQDFYSATMAQYTTLFLILGVVAVGVALISFGLVPLLKKLAAHVPAFAPEGAVLPEHERGEQIGGR
ncbi:MAG: oligopeptide:H+ symporter, partial [Gammaproteobacteria bacterium]|nr:oligopeptide:H+ symporter [Gammaproteobacteria bacterium]